jgi:hypothetical protein
LKIFLVPEHVETRSLYSPEMGPELEQGKIQMWIDMFPYEDYQDSILMGSKFTPVDIEVRKPKRFELRVIVYNTKEVILDDTNPLTGEKSSDIYIKGIFSKNYSNSQKTCVHYRSLNGDGKFNWRFIFKFDYLPPKKKVVVIGKENLFTSLQRGSILGEVEPKLEDPKLKLECYDRDQIGADDFLASVDLNLSKLIIGAKSPNICSNKMFKSSYWPFVDMFSLLDRESRTCRGWWPLFTDNNDYNSKIGVNKQLILSFNLINFNKFSK